MQITNKNSPFYQKPRKPVRKISVKQQQINRELRRIKRELPSVCAICGRTCEGDLAHLLARSLNPEHVTEPWNLRIFCRECHNKYDNDLAFRQQQTSIFKHLCEHDERAARRYFRIYD